MAHSYHIDNMLRMSKIRFSEKVQRYYKLSLTASGIYIQYCEKVMQTIIAEYRSLFLRYIDDISAIYRTYKRCVTMIIRRDIGASHRYLTDISFLRYIAAVIYCSCDISPQRYIVQHATDSLRYIALTRYRYSDIS